MALTPVDAAILEAVELVDVVAELRREIGMRQAKYPQWIQEKKLKPDAAHRQLLRMQKALMIIEKAWANEQEHKAPTLSLEGGSAAPKARGNGENR